METIIKWTNRIALFAILSLIYWVFTFISITVFDFKVFRENLTQIYFLSILGILALMSGSLVVNIMFNLTKISNSLAARHVNQDINPSARIKNLGLYLFLIFPLLFAFLYFGDAASSNQKEKYIVESVQQLIAEYEDTINEFANYNFSETYINETANSLRLLKKIDEHFPNIDIIIQDEVDGRDVFLIFNSYGFKAKDEDPVKVDYIFSSSQDERKFLNDAFEDKIKDYKFSAHDGFYELYYPVHVNERIIVLYLTDRGRYGKIGS